MASVRLGSTVDGAVDPGGVEAARSASASPNDLGGESPPNVGGAELVDAKLALIGVSEVLLSASVRMTAARKRVKWNAELERLSKLDREERATLGIFAPMAAPMFERSLAALPWVGSVAFGFVFLMVMQSRRKEIDSMAPSSTRTSTSSTPAADAAEDLRPADKYVHGDLWGNAADAVPVGTTPVDSGKFPPRKVAAEEGSSESAAVRDWDKMRGGG